MITEVAINLGLFYSILILINIPAPFLGLEFGNEKSPSRYAPPGFVIPVAWFVLFTFLGVARYQLISKGFGHYQGWLIALAIFCASYAYYTLGLAKLTGISPLWYGLVGNLAVIAFAFIVIIRLYSALPLSAFLTLPVILWTAYASLIIWDEIKIKKLI